MIKPSDIHALKQLCLAEEMNHHVLGKVGDRRGMLVDLIHRLVGETVLLVERRWLEIVREFGVQLSFGWLILVTYSTSPLAFEKGERR